METKKTLELAGFVTTYKEEPDPRTSWRPHTPDGWEDYYFCGDHYPDDHEMFVHCPRCSKEAQFYHFGGPSGLGGWVICRNCYFHEIYEIDWDWPSPPEKFAWGNRIIRWPQDAYFQWEVVGETLWAYNREHAQVLLEYIRSKERNEEAFPKYCKTLQRLPRAIVLAKNRDIIVKRLSEWQPVPIR